MKATGIELIAQERSEHFTKHGRTIELDVLQNSKGQLSDAAQWLCLDADYKDERGDFLYTLPKEWDMAIWKKMLFKPYKERLIIAGALIAAEIDRLQAIESNT